MSGPSVDTSHICSPRDPMTPVEREAVRAELRESSEALAAFIAKHGDVGQELREMYGDPWSDMSEVDAA